jgi:hypothetical protein
MFKKVSFNSVRLCKVIIDGYFKNGSFCWDSSARLLVSIFVDELHLGFWFHFKNNFDFGFVFADIFEEKCVFLDSDRADSILGYSWV